jgi:endonuclease/exonuclease/phosphatase family metal-dependent hydrolase/ABC-type dipeptide/oligopeptide/nickel transport system ATPase component
MLDNENEIQILTPSPYYENNSFLEILKSRHDKLKILSLNCQSLNAKYNMLKFYIENYISQGTPLDIICLQETWLADNSDLSLLHLPGYNLISKGKSCSAHGGVAIYLLEHYNYSILNAPEVPEVSDSLFLEISIPGQSHKSDSVVIFSVYKPPRNSPDIIRSFIDNLHSVFAYLHRKKNVIITGDFNLDLLKFRQNTHINEFLESLLQSSFAPKITFPTRLTQRHGSLIDNIFIKLTDNFSHSTAGILLNEISDHLPYFVTLDYLTLHCNKEKYITIYPNYDAATAQLKEDLRLSCSIINFNTDITSSPNSNYDKFNHIIVNSISKIFQSKTIRCNRKKHKMSKWITLGILKSINFRDKLYRKLKTLSQDDPQFRSTQINLKTYNTILKKSIRHAKKLYYQNYFEKYKSDIKRTWNMISTILNKTGNSKHVPEYFIVDGNYLTDKGAIANAFNQYYTELGPNLANRIVIPDSIDFKNYLNIASPPTFEFEHIDRTQILKIIDSLKSKNSSGIDGLSSKMLQNVKYEICDALVVMVNQALSTGIFPDKLKVAKVIPFHKKDEIYKVENYRPISLLPSVSKVFERVIHDQLFQYFNFQKHFYSSQYGFRQQHSTEFAAMELIDHIITEMDRNGLPLSIFLDLSKAFDTLDHTILIHKLKHYGITANALHIWIIDNKSFPLIMFIHHTYNCK